MTLKLGALDVTNVKLGTLTVARLMLGTEQVWPATGAGVVGTIAVVEVADVASIAGTSTAAPAPITGTVAVDEAHDVAEILATFAPTGTAVIFAVEDDHAAAIAGTVTAPIYTGAVAVAEEADLAVIVGTSDVPVYTGTLAVTEVDDTAVIGGTVAAPVYTGAVAVTGADDTSAIAGTATAPVYTGLVAVTEADDTSAIAGTVEYVGVVAVTEATDVAVIAGTSTDPTTGDFTGTVATTEADDVAALVGSFVPPAPVIAATNNEVGTSMGAQPINMPAGITAGDLLVAVAVNDNPSTTDMTASAGWTRLINQAQSTTIKLAAFAKIATGGDTLTITGATQDYCAWTARITGHAITDVNGIAVAGSTSTTGNADPPDLAPGDARSWLWIAADGMDLTTGNTITAVPTGYTDVLRTVSTSSTSSAGLGIGSKTGNTTSEDPGVFTHSPTTRPWCAITLGIPAMAPAPVTGVVAVAEANDTAVIAGNDGTAGTASFVSIAAITGNVGSPFDIAKPAGAAVGDLYVICWYCDINTAVATCTGFVDAGHATYIGFGGAVRAFGVLKRVADGSEGPTFTVAGLAGGGGGYNEAIALAYDASGTGAFGSVNASLNSPALAVGANNSIEMLALNTANATGDFAAPAGWTRRLNGNGTYGFWIADRPVNAGTTTPSTFTGATDLGNGYGILNLVITP